MGIQVGLGDDDDDDEHVAREKRMDFLERGRQNRQGEEARPVQ